MGQGVLAVVRECFMENSHKDLVMGGELYKITK